MPVGEVFLLKKSKTVTYQGGGSGGFGPSPPDTTLVWDWNSYIDRIVYHFLTGWFFLMKLALHFATKLNSWDIKKCNCFWVLSYDPFVSAREAVFPALTVTGVHRGGCSKVVSFTGASAYGKGPKNYNNVQPQPMGEGGRVLSKPKFWPFPSLHPPTPTNKKFLDPPLEKVVDSWKYRAPLHVFTLCQLPRRFVAVRRLQ